MTFSWHLWCATVSPLPHCSERIGEPGVPLCSRGVAAQRLSGCRETMSASVDRPGLPLRLTDPWRIRSMSPCPMADPIDVPLAPSDRSSSMLLGSPRPSIQLPLTTSPLATLPQCPGGHFSSRCPTGWGPRPSPSPRSHVRTHRSGMAGRVSSESGTNSAWMERPPPRQELPACTLGGWTSSASVRSWPGWSGGRAPSEEGTHA